MAQPPGPGQTTGFFKEARQPSDGDHPGSDGQEGTPVGWGAMQWDGRPWRNASGCEQALTPWPLSVAVLTAQAQPLGLTLPISGQEAEGGLWSQTRLGLNHHHETQKSH